MVWVVDWARVSWGALWRGKGLQPAGGAAGCRDGAAEGCDGSPFRRVEGGRAVEGTMALAGTTTLVPLARGISQAAAGQGAGPGG